MMLAIRTEQPPEFTGEMYVLSQECCKLGRKCKVLKLTLKRFDFWFSWHVNDTTKYKREYHYYGSRERLA